jgi:DNA-binding transcriptional ArsR family regulator
MAPDLLSTIRREIDERLSELRPLLAEHEQLLVAADALEGTGQGDGSDAATNGSVPATRAPATRASATRASATRASATRASATRASATRASATRASATPAPATHLEGRGKLRTTRRGSAAGVIRRAAAPSAKEAKPARAARGAAREAILAALDHGSHTVGELVVVTAMSGPNLNGNLRRLASDGVVVKTEREGKTAWTLPGAAA